MLAEHARRRGIEVTQIERPLTKAVRIACLELDVEALLASRGVVRRERPKLLRNTRRRAHDKQE